ncbi:MAG: hypothetical protein AAFX81_18885 [Pseudomonadota bacterium]
MMLLATLGAAAATAPTMTWGDAVATFRGEKERAERCVRTLKRFRAADAEVVDDADRRYTEARADVDAVISRLIVAMRDEGSDPALATLEPTLRAGVEAREAFCIGVDEEIEDPDAPDDPAKNLGDTLGFVGDVLQAFVDLLGLYRDEVESTRQTIETQLEAARWRTFGSITP